VEKACETGNSLLGSYLSEGGGHEWEVGYININLFPSIYRKGFVVIHLS
jgi:hypothetical protein